VTTVAELGLYVYGLVAADELESSPEIAGVDGVHAVECLRQGDLCALVSRVRLADFEEQPLREHLADMAWVEQTARRHQQVLDTVLGRCTPLPMRLCTLYADEQGLRQMLDHQHDDLTAALGDLRGTLEWGVQGFAGARRAAPAGAGSPQAAGSGFASGRDYLQQKLQARRVDEQADTELGQLCDHVHAELCSVALAGRLGAPQRPEPSTPAKPMVLNAFYLVANGQRDAFAARVTELHNEHSDHGLELQLTGPWPPYNFVTAAFGGAA
jgi:hypothetical protein